MATKHPAKAETSKKTDEARSTDAPNDGVTPVDGVLRDEIGRNVGGFATRPPHTSGTKDASKNPGEPGSGTGADAPDPRELEAQAPEIKGQVAASGSDRAVKIGDAVLVHTPNPINAMVDNRATVTRLNRDGTINVEVSRDNGTVQEVSGVKNARPQPGDVSPWFEWPAEESKAAKAA